MSSLSASHSARLPPHRENGKRVSIALDHLEFRSVGEWMVRRRREGRVWERLRCWTRLKSRYRYASPPLSPSSLHPQSRQLVGRTPPEGLRHYGPTEEGDCFGLQSCHGRRMVELTVNLRRPVAQPRPRACLHRESSPALPPAACFALRASWALVGALAGQWRCAGRA